MLVFDGMINAKTIKPQGTDQSAIMNVLRPPGDEWTMAAHSQPGLRHCVLACISCPHEVGAMSSQVELCEHHAKDCLQAAERTEDPLAREMLLRNALEWLRDGLAASKQSKLCRVCGRKAAPGSSLVH
jgi:hypothetical protein